MALKGVNVINDELDKMLEDAITSVHEQADAALARINALFDKAEAEIIGGADERD